MPDLQKTQRERSKKLEEMRALLTKAHEEKRELSEDEINKFNGLDEESGKLNESIDRELKLSKLESETRTIPDIKMDDKKGDNSDGDNRDNNCAFENLGEFFATIAFNRNSPELKPYYRKGGTPAQERAAQKMGTGSLGGFALPDQLFKGGVKSVAPQGAIVRPRATIIEPGDPPDSKIRLPALDQGAAQNMYGGIQVVHSGETLSITETNMNLRSVTLEPKSLKGFIPVSNELMNNWGACGSFLKKQLKLAVKGAEDYDQYRGSGVNMSMGILNLSCKIEYTRATANTIAYADVLGMFARAKLGGNLVWVASQTCIPQLATIRDAGSNNLWIQNAATGVPSKMLGFDILWNDRSPVLGTTGDLTLCDMDYYLIKDGSGPRVDVSTEFLFQNDETAFRIVWFVDGQSWLNEPIPLEGSTANTVSPFIILKSA